MCFFLQLLLCLFCFLVVICCFKCFFDCYRFFRFLFGLNSWLSSSQIGYCPLDDDGQVIQLKRGIRSEARKRKGPSAPRGLVKWPLGLKGAWLLESFCGCLCFDLWMFFGVFWCSSLLESVVCVCGLVNVILFEQLDQRHLKQVSGLLEVRLNLL